MRRVAVAVLLVLLAACGGADGKRDAKSDGDGASSRLNTGEAPWPAPADAGAAIAAAGLPALRSEGTVVHFHAQLFVFVDGAPQPVPKDIGVDFDARRISPLHTHTDDGIVHVEANEESTFTLGQFFTQWGVRLTPDCVGGYCGPTRKPTFYVDGKEFTGDPRTIEITGNREIALVVGKPPPDIPATATFVTTTTTPPA